MYISEALTKLKNLKSRAARTTTYINESATFYEDVAPEYDYETEMVTLRGINNEILKLKTRIQITNATTLVDYKGTKITLAEVILLNASIRSELAFIATQMAHTVSSDNHYRSRSKEDVKKLFAKGCDKNQFKKEVDQLEKDKEEIESVMANANASTLLV